MQNNFKQFLLLENEQFLAVQMNNVLQDLQDEIENIGTKNLVKTSQLIANNIRNIIKSHWEISTNKPLVSLQKCGVAILKAIQEKSDLKDVFPSLIEEIQKAISQMKEPVNRIANPSAKSEKDQPVDLSKSGDLSPENLPLTSGSGSIEKPPMGQMY